MTTTIPGAQRRKLVRKYDSAEPAPFSATPPPGRVPRAERVYYFDSQADAFYWIHTADVIALRLHCDSLRAQLHKEKSDHNWWLRGEARRYLSSGLGRLRLERITALETELANVRALLPVKHAPGSVPKHEPSVYVELAERGHTNVEIAALVDPPVSEAAVRRGLAKAGYKRTKSSPKAPRRAQRHTDEKKS